MRASTFSVGSSGQIAVERKRRAWSSAESIQAVGELVRDRIKSRAASAEESGRRQGLTLDPHALVAGGALVAALVADHLPADPAGGVDQAVRRGEDFRRFIQELQ